MEVIKQNQQAVKINTSEKNKAVPKTASKTAFNKKPAAGVKPKNKKPEAKIQVVEKVRFKNGKK